MCGGGRFLEKCHFAKETRQTRGCRETWHLQGAQRISWFQAAALLPHRAMEINQQGNAQIPILGTAWKDQVTHRRRNPKSSTGREESRYEPSVPGGNVSGGQLKGTALNRSAPNELWAQRLAGQLEDPITPNPHGLSENDPKAKQIEEVTALSCKPQHRQAPNAFPFLKIDFLFSKSKYKMSM